MSIEKRVADAILQRPHTITLHGIKYEVLQPTIATLIAISEKVAELPEMQEGSESNPLLVMQDIKNCQVIGDVLATLICGIKKRKWYDFGYKRRFKRLSAFIINNTTPAELCAVLGEIIKAMQLMDFFVLTASLKGLNLLKVADKTTTASGQ